MSLLNRSWPMLYSSTYGMREDQTTDLYLIFISGKVMEMIILHVESHAEKKADIIYKSAWVHEG